jgi:serine/threonine-protein kinase
MLREAGVDETLLRLDASGTIAGVEDGTLPTEISELPLLDAELIMRGRIGIGGMGEVLLAEQRALKRDVAVKRGVVRATTDRREAASALLREARVTGLLEHPNIVPTHALGRTADGDVLFVMKRIEGRSWAEILARRPTLDDEIERHVRILMDVCRAVELAHVRGIVHRDLKAENVMVGLFGEVYVLDWGIAACIGERRLPGVLHVDELTSLAGTPSYMAPEMTLPGEPIDARTDVFLLGGLLHVVLTGRPPHAGATMPATLHAAFLAEPPTLPADAAVELAEACRRSLARDPDERFPSAAAVSSALADFLKHASARAATREANGPLTALRALVHARDADDLEAHRAYSACRFGYELALREWPGSLEARNGLDAANAAMATYEIGRRHADAARVLVGEMHSPPEELVAELVALERSKHAEAAAKARLDALARDVDARPGQHWRIVVMAVLCSGWLAFALFSGSQLRAGSPPSTAELALANMAFAIVAAAISFIRRGVARSKFASAHLNAVPIACAGVALSWSALWLGRTDVTMHVGLAIAHVELALVAAIGALYSERRMLLAAGVLLAGAGGILLLPRFCFEVNGFDLVITIAVVAYALKPRGDHPGAPKPSS